MLIALGRSRAALHAGTRISIAVEIRPRETIRQCFQEGDDLVFLLIRQAKIAGSHVNIVPHLRHGPAVYFFRRSLGQCPEVTGYAYLSRVL